VVLELSRQRGFSIVEALVAAALILVIASGVLPMFTRAMVNNVAGNESTLVSNYSKSQTEELFQQPFGNLEIPAGQAQLTLPMESWAAGSPDHTADANEGWWPNPAGKGIVRWQRQTVVRQYNVVEALEDGVIVPSEALDGGTAPEFVHFKEIDVDVKGLRVAGAFEEPKKTGVRLLKSH
jgi:type II secretory pathway pseudopilin PulG